VLHSGQRVSLVSTAEGGRIVADDPATGDTFFVKACTPADCERYGNDLAKWLGTTLGREPTTPPEECVAERREPDGRPEGGEGVETSAEAETTESVSANPAVAERAAGATSGPAAPRAASAPASEAATCGEDGAAAAGSPGATAEPAGGGSVPASSASAGPAPSAPAS
jgi:hypothetical protein